MNFFRNKTSKFLSKLNDNFSENSFEVVQISVGLKIKILENLVAGMSGMS
jgi:hypothetical protein